MTRTTPLVALAATAMLAAPLAFAQSAAGEANRGAASMTQATPPQSTGAQDTAGARSSETTAERLGDATAPVTTGTNNPATTLDRTEQNAMTRDRSIPEHAQGAQHAAPRSTAAQRGVWTQLDTDGDGRISVTEGEASADFNRGFSAMDTDGDGYVSDTEYRAHARTTHPQNRGDAVTQDPTLDGGSTAGRERGWQDADDVRDDDIDSDGEDLPTDHDD